MRSKRAYGVPESLASEIQTQLERLGGTGNAPLGDVVHAWPAAVGPAIAANAWPARTTRDGTLVVHTSSSVWAHELTQLEAELRQRLGTTAPPRMRFVVGLLPDSDSAGVTEVEQRVHRPTAAERTKAGEIAQSISDPELRSRVAEAIAHSLATARCAGRNRAV